MDLLVIKNENDYIRVNGESYTAVGLDKASVFPLGRLDRVEDLLACIRDSGFRGAAIYRLTLTETPF